MTVFALLLCSQALGICSALESGMSISECADRKTFYSERITDQERLYCLKVAE